MRHLKTTLGAAVLVSAMVVGVAACGDDDNVGPNPTNEAGADQTTPPPNDGGGGTDAPTGDGGGGCNFNDFVIDLINKNTTPNALPSTDLGEACVDNQTPFPATLFQ